MKPVSFSWHLFDQIPIIGIMRNIPVDRISEVAAIFADEGLTNLEITLNSPNAVELITKLSARFKGQINVGAGTVCTSLELDMALSAGAAFIVTPIVNEEIIQKCVLKGIPVFPGAYTPTEIYKANSFGASMIKVFPASTLGPRYIKELLGPFPHFKLLPTGGISLENMDDFMKAGAKGIGIGSHLFPIEIIQQERWEDLRKIFARARDAFRNNQRL
jgi:2-dehydro-3-deoxyphosphogluconate aldolase/(4S)-4-hydroxy-2-oxoglutarate aldolase